MGVNSRGVAARASIVAAAGLLAACGGTATSGSRPQPREATTSLTVISPRDGLTVHSSRLALHGTATPGASVEINDNGDQEIATAGPSGTWKTSIHLQLGSNPISISAVKSGSGAAYLPSPSQAISVTYALTSAEIAARKAAAAKRAAAARAAAAEKVAQDQQNFINAAATIPYAQLIKDTGPYVGKKVVLHGQIFQIQQQQGQGGVMLLAVTDDGYGNWTDHVWIDYGSDVPYVTNDIVTVYGVVVGTKSYQTQVGGTTYVPEVSSRYINGSQGTEKNVGQASGNTGNTGNTGTTGNTGNTGNTGLGGTGNTGGG